MATLCPGNQYGLSSKKNSSETKDVIFVKLTDSALRSIEEYMQNRNKLSFQQTPKIKFTGNEGVLQFPSLNNGTSSFSFSMSTTQDMEGPGGSFECIGQNGPSRGSLELLNPIPNKIRIHANDDIYAATKQRMTVAEETQKNKCTREIKPNQTDIGRRVKVKQTQNSGGRPSLPQIPQRVNGNGIERNGPSHPSMRDTLLKSSYQTPLNSKPPSSNGLPPINGMPHHMSNGLGNHAKPPQNKPTQPDILKRPLKERLIHLLALRPYKKVELFERLNREGLREKGSMSSVLKQVSFLKDNAYHLNRVCWHDVRENWPFYTETEKQILKRRKPQNLTPPGSSDSVSSGGSGQSPNSQHPGSPPLPIPTSAKRPGYYDDANGFPTKRQRVSHYKKPTEPTVNQPPAETKSQRRPVTDSRDSSNMNPRSREAPPPSAHLPTNHAPTNGYHHNNNNNYNHHAQTNGHTNGKRYAISDDEDEEPQNGRKRHCDGYNRLGFDSTRPETTDRGSPRRNGYEQKRDVSDYGFPEEVKGAGYTNGHGVDSAYATASQDRWALETKRESGKYEQQQQQHHHQQQREASSSSSRSSSERISPIGLSEPSAHDGQTGPANGSFRDGRNGPPAAPNMDYVTQFTTIQNYEQRKQYKEAFNVSYNEYKVLHERVDKVSKRFLELEERLRTENANSDSRKDVKKTIMKEYKEIKKSTNHHQDRDRFQYLHEKLSHIKNLIKDYDDRMTSSQRQRPQDPNHRY